MKKVQLASNLQKFFQGDIMVVNIKKNEENIY